MSFSPSSFQQRARMHQPSLDGIRGIAVIAVLLTHGVTVSQHFQTGFLSRVAAYLFTPGWAGVDLFFVLSGFLITGILLSTKGARNYFQSFYMRRVLRISPIYYLVVIALLLAGTESQWVASRLPSWPFRLTYLAYLQNVPAFLFSGQLGHLFGHFWSLAVEEQFYLVWPLLVLLLPERFVLGLCAVGMLMALPLRTYLVLAHPNDFRVMCLTTSRLDGLLIGAGCATYMHIRQRAVPLRWIAVGGGLGAIIIGYIAAYHRGELLGTSFWMPTIGITGFALLSGALVALSQHRFEIVNKPLSVGWLRAFGKYSYGIYVYHILIYQIGQTLLEKSGVRLPLGFAGDLAYLAVLIGVTFAVAKLSYDNFEVRFLRLKHHFEPEYTEIPVQSEALVLQGADRQRTKEAASGSS